MNEFSMTLGRRPLLLLDRLGAELRPRLNDTMHAPLPAELQALCDALADRLGATDQARDAGI